MQMKISETALVDMVTSFLLEGGGKVFAEVASLGQSADLVYLCGTEVTFVEVKVNAISRAIGQCRAHELVADYICIATATKSISANNLDTIKELGYGLISCQVGGRCTWIVRPKKLAKYWGPIRTQVVERILVGVRDGT